MLETEAFDTVDANARSDDDDEERPVSALVDDG